ncbi:hypothetical protein HYPSUDRAFT_67359 [Hypholoma sublateritium FD-334 SS-4]|uniref:Uncharacterized protein n=1 Tax=Hypholoma sublateritium (strain FD-334 SS-4) TaxID=945553 RepID=A0A0D2PQ87_HYPSF|nr:hypothetical protein HYPSUDRAFT_67359 [Hypholoma sublateritium FD-334 SS-4]
MVMDQAPDARGRWSARRHMPPAAMSSQTKPEQLVHWRPHAPGAVYVSDFHRRRASVVGYTQNVAIVVRGAENRAMTQRRPHPNAPSHFQLKRSVCSPLHVPGSRVADPPPEETPAYTNDVRQEAVLH